MAYEMVMPYHLHMPSYFLETFTEYPILNTLSEEEYAEMKKRTAKIGERLSQGHFVRKALQEAIERL